MKTNQALIRKDILVLGKKIYIPVWIVAGIYAMLILGIILSFLIQSGHIATIEGETMTFGEAIRQIPPEIAEQSRQISYTANYIMALSISILFLFNLLLVVSNVLNVNHRDNYELFHRAQPVSIFSNTIAKITAIVGSNWLIFAGLCLLNFLIVNITAAILLRGVMSWDLWVGFVGMIHWVIPALVITVILTAVTFFSSAIFQDSANAKFGGTIVGLWIIVMILNKIYGWNIPSPLSYFISVLNIGWGNMNKGGINSANFTLPSWSFFFNWSTLIHIIAGGVFFYLATIIYSKREIKQ